MFKSTQFRLQLTVLLWGFTGVLGKLITVSAIPLVWYRVLIATIVLFGVLKFSKISFKISQKNLWMLLGIGAIIGFHWLTFFESIKVSNVAVALSTLSMGALFSAFLEPLFFKRKINISEIILAIIVSLCILLIYNAKPEYWLGLVLGIFSSFLSALFSVINGKIHAKFPPQKIMFYEILGSLLIVSLFMLGFEDVTTVAELSWRDLGLLILLGSLFTVYPMIEAVNLMKHISPYTLLLNVNLEPVYGIILAWFIFGESEKMTLLFYIATAIMVLTIVTNVLLKKKTSKPVRVKSKFWNFKSKPPKKVIS